jgi:hypothetical protein
MYTCMEMEKGDMWKLLLERGRKYKKEWWRV